MLAGGMVIAAPSMVPEAAAAGQLYVSAENATFGNTFGGGSVVEVIVKDPNRSDTEVAEAEPTVYVDNQQLRMAQGVDGYWYAYIGAYDNNAGAAIDGATGFDAVFNNLEYGIQVADNLIGQDHLAIRGAADSDVTHYASAVMLNGGMTNTTIANPPTLSDYNHTSNVGGDPITSNADQTSTLGQIGINGTEWPFIQLFDFTQGTFDIVLSQAGQDEIVTLDYDSSGLDGFAGIESDRLSATQGSDVHLTITDQALNIDPTNEDVVIFYVPEAGTAGTVSFTNGTSPNLSAHNALVATAVNDYFQTSYIAESMGFGDNGVLKINYDANGISTNVFTNTATADDTAAKSIGGAADYYLVFVESGDNTGIFGNTDDNSESNIEVNSSAKRGTTATIDYNDSAVSFVVANSFGDLDMDESSIGDEWNSGETLAVTLVDQDLNKNTLSNEDMVMTKAYNSTIPSLQIGSPITLSEDSCITGGPGTYGSALNLAGFCSTVMNVTTFSKIATLVNVAATQDLVSKYTQFTMNGTTVADARTALDAAAFTFANYDLTEMVGAVTGVTLVDASGDALQLREHRLRSRNASTR